ncbi:MAG TPA: bifunctional diguanylate cyclase/phosphodiesterase, partial [Sphingomicrobium sp.]|nr:bifunctional diguanylate cyclase/phosphodiesterase [Sphingomicrobium sp.]
VNDTLGHPIGDELLKQAAVRLRDIAGKDEFVSRLAGDEFAVIQRRIKQPRQAELLADRIIAGLSNPFEIDGHTIAIGASVGIALAPKDSRDGAELLKKSDLALYWAKNVGRGGFCFYKPRMDKHLNERRALGNDLRAAVQNGQFELYYQPLLNLSSRRICGMEALVRWHHPRRGMLQPSDFIPVAEESGLIVPIGEWVLRQACIEAANWPKPISVAVNLSAAQFKRGDLLAMTTAALKAAGLESGRLELEITESVLLNDEIWVRNVLCKLRDLGVRLAMDDFGTGYSSLSYLRSFPFSKIKIDRSFVSDITVTRDALAIVQATIQLSEKLGIGTTAEGIETAGQLHLLAAEGCTEAQGFHISRPVRAQEIPALISRYGCHVERPALRVAS